MTTATTNRRFRLMDADAAFDAAFDVDNENDPYCWNETSLTREDWEHVHDADDHEVVRLHGHRPALLIA